VISYSLAATFEASAEDAAEDRDRPEALHPAGPVHDDPI